MLESTQLLLFDDRKLFGADFVTKNKSYAKGKRTNPLFLRNDFPGAGKYGMPIVHKQEFNLDNVRLIAYTNTVQNDYEYCDSGVHFFVDDYRFEDIYDDPGKSFSVLSQYQFCCTPDFSTYSEMPTWRQIESVAHGRWCGAWWQSKGMKVMPTVSWDKYPSYEFCFDGIESGSVVVISTYACLSNKTGFVRGYDAMLERINPEAVVCYGKPLPQMRGNIIPVPIVHPRQFHREVKRNNFQTFNSPFSKNKINAPRYHL